MKKLFLFLLFAAPSWGQTQRISSDQTISSGTFETIELALNAQLTISGEVQVKHFKRIGSSAVKVEVKPGAVLRITDALTMDGNTTIISRGIIYSKGVLMNDGTINLFWNLGTHHLDGDLMIHADNSGYKNAGKLDVSGTTTLSKGSFILEECGYLQTANLTALRRDALKGEGFIKVNGKVVTLAELTYSEGISLCYTGTGVIHVGSAVRQCSGPCAPPTLKYEALTFSQQPSGEMRVSFKVTEVNGIKDVKVNYSLDGISWKGVVVVLPEKVVAGKVYVGTFKIK